MTTLYTTNVKVTVFTASGTWNKDIRTKQLLVEVLGGGGGSRGGSGTGGNGGSSSFASYISANGGQGAAAGGVVGASASYAANKFSFPGGVGAALNQLGVAASDVGAGGACFLSPPRYRPGSTMFASQTSYVAANESNRGCGASTSSNNAGLPWGGGGGAYAAQVFNHLDVADSGVVTVGAGGSGAGGGFTGGAGLVIVTEFF